MIGSWRLRALRGQTYEWLQVIMARRFTPGNYLVINGFWRSGTTWLQQAVADSLSARCVYEPLESRNAPFIAYVCQRPLPRTNTEFINALFPFARDDFSEDPELERLLRRALAGGWWLVRYLEPLATAIRGQEIQRPYAQDYRNSVRSRWSLSQGNADRFRCTSDSHLLRSTRSDKFAFLPRSLLVG